MRLVMDVLFGEYLKFELSQLTWNQCRVMPSQAEVLRVALESVGVELIDYDSFTAHPLGVRHLITVYSRTYRERLERAPAPR